MTPWESEVRVGSVITEHDPMGGNAMQTGNRAYSSIERKRRSRQNRRSGKGNVSAARRRSDRDKTRALRAKGFL